MTTTTRPADAGPITTEELRADLELTRQHLAGTVQELSRQLNVPRRIKESAAGTGHRVAEAASHAGRRVADTASQLTGRARTTAEDLGEKAGRLPEAGRHNPGATAAIGGAVALGVGAAVWIARRGR